jgi:hypothetical protein
MGELYLQFPALSVRQGAQCRRPPASQSDWSSEGGLESFPGMVGGFWIERAVVM